MCPCALPSCPPATYLGSGGTSSRALAVTAARLKAIGDELQARALERRAEVEAAWRRRRQRRASAGTGLATSLLLLLAAWAWLSRRRSV